MPTPLHGARDKVADAIKTLIVPLAPLGDLTTSAPRRLDDERSSTGDAASGADLPRAA